VSHPIHDLEDDVHQRVRLGILASLIGLARADFAHLKRTLGLNDGNLGRHLEVLESAGLISISREAEGRRTRTWVRITRSGRTALRRELQALRQIIAQVDEHGELPAAPQRPSQTTMAPPQSPP
jgi:DNA-binding MarR family transcriptional regulator